MRKLLLFFVGVCFSLSVYSQAQLTVFPDWTSTTGSQNFFVKNVTKTFGNYVYIAGATLNSAGNYDCLIAKYSTTGVLQWEKQYDGIAHYQDVATAVYVDNGGSVYITGETVADSVYHTSDVITIKYNSSGVQQWATRYNGTGGTNDAGADITVDNTTGNVFVAGGSYNAAGTPNSDMIALCYNSSGVQQWIGRYDGASHLDDAATRIAINSTTVTITGAVQTGTTTYQYGVIVYAIGTGVQNSATITTGGTSGIATVTDMVKDASGNIYICGSQAVTGHGQDYCLIKISAAMAIAWTVNYNGSASLDDIANSVRVDASGNIFVTGSAQNTSHGKDYVTLKYNSSGTLQWTQTYNDALNLDDEATAMSIDNSGNIYVTGYTTTAMNQADYYTIKYNTSGTQQWSVNTDGAAHLMDKASSIAVDTTGLIVVTGQSQLTATTYQYLTVRYIEKNIITPTDYNSEVPSQSFGYFQNGGQLLNTSNAAIPTEKYYTQKNSPQYYISNTNFSFVYSKVDTIYSTTDTMQRVDVTFKNGSAAAKVYSMEQQSDYLNYFLSHIPNGVTEVNRNNRLVMTDIYPNIDLMYSSNQNGFKYYFIIKPGGSPTSIDVQYTGASSTALNGTTHYLSINTPVGNLVFDRPTVYQLSSTNTIIPITTWNADFVSSGTNSYKFNIGTYNNTEAMIIQVDQGNATLSSIGNVSWSTFFHDGVPKDIKTDNVGKQYVTGYTSDAGFPAASGLYTSLSPSHYIDAFFGKFNKVNQIEWVTFWGGAAGTATGDRDEGFSIDIDASHNVYVAGSTWSSLFPVFPTPTGSYYQPNIGSYGYPDNKPDIFLIKVDSLGGVGLGSKWSTYFGSAEIEDSPDMRLDGLGNMYVSAVGGYYSSSDPTHSIVLHTLAGALNDTIGASLILKFSTSAVYKWGSFFGGNGTATNIWSLDVDANNAFYITGQTSGGTGFPIVSPGANSIVIGAYPDAFVTKFTTADAVSWSTYLGGNKTDAGYGIAAIGKDVYVTGFTNSSDTATRFPIKYHTGEYIDSTYGGSSGGTQGDVFVSRFDQNSGALKWSTYYGDTYQEAAYSICGDAKYNVFLTGYTQNSAFHLPSPNLTGAYAQTYLGPTGSTGGNAFILAFNAGNRLRWGTFYSGTAGSGGNAITAYKDSTLYLTGTGAYAGATPFPIAHVTSPAPYFTTTGSMFIAKFDLSVLDLVGIEEYSKPQGFDFTAFPNPSNGTLNLLLDNKGKEYYISIYNSIGQEIFTKKSDLENQTIDLNDYNSGVYIIRVNSQDKFGAKKIIIQK